MEWLWPSPKGRDYTPGQLLGCVSGELGLRKFLESNGHEFIVTNSKDGDGCEADKHIVDADIVISQPFFPYYLTKERIAKRLNELVLLSQPYIKDSAFTVEDLVKQAAAKIGENIKVRRFTRYTLGEGIEKNEMDFADEVASLKSN